jgi:hypothetical protein
MAVVKVTGNQLDRLFGKQPRPSTSASLDAYRREYPQDCEPSPPGFFAHHVLEQPVTCGRCGALSRHLVQCYGAGPCSIGDVVCLACGTQEKRLGKPLKKKRQKRLE